MNHISCQRPSLCQWCLSLTPHTFEYTRTRMFFYVSKRKWVLFVTNWLGYFAVLYNIAICSLSLNVVQCYYIGYHTFNHIHNQVFMKTTMTLQSGPLAVNMPLTTIHIKQHTYSKQMTSIYSLRTLNINLHYWITHPDARTEKATVTIT